MRLFMSPSLASTFEVLNTLRPRRPPQRAGLELKAHRFSVYCILISLVFMALMLVLAAFHIFISQLHRIGTEVALTFGTAASLLGALSMVSTTVEVSASIVDMVRNQSREFLKEVEWDLLQAGMLESLNKADLVRALQFLELKSSRVQERIKRFIGGPDKIALPAIFGGAWLLYKELPAIFTFELGPMASREYFTQLIIWAALAFTIGIVAGAVASSYRLRHYTYQIEVLKLHLATRV